MTKNFSYFVFIPTLVLLQLFTTHHTINNNIVEEVVPRKDLIICNIAKPYPTIYSADIRQVYLSYASDLI